MAAMVTAMLACSGPGALAHIHENIAISTVLHAVAMAFAFAALVAFAIRSRRYGRLASTLVLAGLHPAWWVPAYSGDCGESALPCPSSGPPAAPSSRSPCGRSRRHYPRRGPLDCNDARAAGIYRRRSAQRP